MTERKKEFIPEPAERMIQLMRRMRQIHFWEVSGEIRQGEGLFLREMYVHSDENHSIPLSELTRHLHMLPAGVSRLMKSMEAQGLIVRTVDPDNRRNITVQATEKGWKLAEEHKEAVEQYWGEVFEKLPAEEWDTLYKIMGDLIDSMEQVLEQKKASAGNGKER